MTSTIYAAGYGRQSQKRANASEASPATQRSANKAEADRRAALPGVDLAWTRHYEDIGISAFTGKERPEFDRLLADCRAGRVNMIIVYYISRFSRMEPLDAIPIVTDLLNRGVTIVSVTEGEFRQGNIMDLIHLIMRLDAAHGESKNKSVAVTGAKKKARELGGYVGGRPPYGRECVPETRYDSEGKPIVVQLLSTLVKEAEVIQAWWIDIKRYKDDPTICRAERKGLEVPGSLGWVVRKSNENRVPTRGANTGKLCKNSQWHLITVKRILRDPQIAGYASEPVYKVREDGTKTSSVDHYRIVRDENGNPLQPWEPILDPADWWELQAWLDDSRQQKKWSNVAQSVLTGQQILYCECDAPMKSAPARRTVASYMCGRPAGVRRPGMHEGGVSISQGSLNDLVARRIFAFITAAEYDEQAALILRGVQQRFGEAVEAPETAQERAALRGELADATRALEQLYDDAELYRGDAVGRKRWRKDVETQQQRQKQAEERMEELSAAESPELPILAWLDRDDGFEGDPIGPGTWWGRATLTQRRELVSLFVARIVVRKAREDERTRPGTTASTWVEDRAAITWVQPQAEEEDEEMAA
ncbi:recombinase family protein [Streptomyces olivoreticuli]|uniref:recombinase family protein n=1 Tax=Streptomyces olivoreticuli TaxID=68246 RepID=UPI0013C2AE57|nr:recombinase family protein [Streptomyces olivoreticuli]